MPLDLEAVSGICGSISIACWVVVFSPQIIENFRRGSAEGLSIVFIVVWLVGDIFNIVGAILQGLLPTMIILAVYYTFADIVLILQCFYYRGFTLKDTVPSKQPAEQDTLGPGEPTERSALLSHPVDTSGPPRVASQPNTPGAQANANPFDQETPRRSSFRDHISTLDGTHLSPTKPIHSPKRDIAALKAQSPIQKNRSLLKSFLFNATAVVLVCGAGALGWWLSTRVPSHSYRGDGIFGVAHSKKHGHRHDNAGRQRSELHFNVLGQVFGYICAVLYLGSRLPQLLLNYRRKSTDGISMLFFLFACIGNFAYVLSILAYEPACYRDHGYAVAAGSCEPGEAGQLYLRNFLVNFSWLLGSFGTLLLDAGVFWQWYIYRNVEDGQGLEESNGQHEIAVSGDENVRR